jgi:hypothetical protein
MQSELVWRRRIFKRWRKKVDVWRMKVAHPCTFRGRTGRGPEGPS